MTRDTSHPEYKEIIANAKAGVKKAKETFKTPDDIIQYLLSRD